MDTGMKKLGRFKQWAGEKMGQEARTETSEDFKSLEAEMDLRYEGMDKMHKSMTTYVKWIGKRTEDREKSTPTGNLGSTYIAHGQDFAPESDYGSCLSGIGRAHEGMARKQEAYLANATSTWLESLERSLAQMKDYQAARKKLEQRRIAYDAASIKVQKAKKEDYRVEEELRAQKAKYEEANEDTHRRMLDIKETEVDSIAGLTAFLDAELAYHESCRDILMNLRREWPGEARQRPRANTGHSYNHRPAYDDDSPVREKAPILPTRIGRTSPPREPTRPSYGRTLTSDSYQRSDSPMSRISSAPPRSSSWSAIDRDRSPEPVKATPPPVNRAKKPPPPPPPIRRSALSSSQVPQF